MIITAATHVSGGEFFGTWILLIVAWVATTAGLGLLFKIMWKIFMFGWELV